VNESDDGRQLVSKSKSDVGFLHDEQRVLERFSHAEDLVKTEKQSRRHRIVVLTHRRILPDGCDT
jgi:hypothetical protein